jgi:PEP-CTERM motif
LRKLWFILACVVAVGMPTRASASELLYQQMGLHDIVTIVGANGAESASGSYYAGEIDWIWNGGTPPGFSDAVTTYCVDILHELGASQTVEIGTTAGLVTPAENGGGKAAWLLNTFAPLVTTGVQAAGLQVAIWESLYDNDHNLGGGTFSLVTSNAAYTGAATALAIAGQANQYLDQLYSNPSGGYYTSTAAWLHAVAPTGGQDQITTPEPGSLLLLGIGGVVARLYRRRTAAAQAV